ncbi:MAG: response regulator transcription factor, partial [Beijerinckiaceae bacterium]
MTTISEDRSLLIMDDDKPFLERLGRAMEARGYQVTQANSVAAGMAAIGAKPPAFAVIDMRLADGNGIEVISELKRVRP